MMTILFQPYPIRYSNKFFIYAALGIGSYIFFMNLLFNDTCKEIFNLKGIVGLSLFSVLMAFAFWMYCMGVKVLFKIKKEDWKIFHQIIFTITLILFMNGVNYLLLMVKDPAREIGIGLMRTNFIALLGATFTSFLDYFTALRTERNHYKKLNKQIEKTRKKGIVIPQLTIATLKTKSGAEATKINMETLLYIKAAGNYVEIYTKNSKTLLRISMTNVEKQLQSYEYIRRCHRSYIVNLKQVQATKGNSHKSILLLKNAEIPISKNYYRLLKSSDFWKIKQREL